MRVNYNIEFTSLVKATILKEVRGYEPTMSKARISTNDFTMNELLIEWDWAKGTPRNISSLRNAITLAVRHKNANHELIFRIISQALNKGVDYVLTRQNSDSRKFCNMIIAVRNELRKAKLSIRFQKIGNTLVSNYLLSHNITDLLQQFYKQRFPSKTIIINNYYSKTINNTKLPVNNNKVIKPVSASVITLKSFF